MPDRRRITIPSPSLVVLIGVSGSGKSTFCSRVFRATEIISTDGCRALLCDDPGNQEVSEAAFDLAHRITDERLRRARLTVFDATSLRPADRQALLAMAARHHLPAVAIVLDPPLEECIGHDRARAAPQVGQPVIERQHRLLREQEGSLPAEGFAAVHHLRGRRAAARTALDLTPLSCDRGEERGPFDIVGDVHGCASELTKLLGRLGYRRASRRKPFHHPEGRRVVLVGDLVDRGPGIVESAGVAMDMVAAGSALCVAGNHEMSLASCLLGKDPVLSPGTRRSLQQIDGLPAAARRRFVKRFLEFVAALPSHLVLDGGRLTVAHAGIKSEQIGRDSAEVRRFAAHGDTTGEVDLYGLPVRIKWAAAYRGRPLVVYGHTPVLAVEWINNTVNIDTGCVYGGSLTALRYPERLVVRGPAERAHYRSPRVRPRGVGLRAATRALPPLQAGR